MTEPPPGFVAIARILSARGVRGNVNIEPLAGKDVLRPGRVVSIAGRDSHVELIGGGGRVYMKLAGIDDRETASALRGQYVLVRESDLEPLPEGQFYRFQLIGLRVVTTDGRDLGHITEVITARENDVFVVTGSTCESLIPVIEDVVRDIDVESRTVTIEVIPGLLKD